MQDRAKALQSPTIECNRCHANMFLDEYFQVLFWHCTICGNVIFVPDETAKKRVSYKKYFEKGVCRTCNQVFVKYKSDQYLCPTCSRSNQRYYERECVRCNKTFYAKKKYAKLCNRCLRIIRSINATRRANSESKSYRQP
ncbi:MAG TPA: hypothetical protein PKV92_07695 [Thermodesulfovibrio thiophilus]|nr:hypothetical protein [Thermodesulfovibrio thiophilus]HQD36960.1 hypothetical protein [Thermodesulfovibrio thiophilus]